MALMKSVLLGSAATLMVVAGAQAADLPTKKGAPAAEYVKVCKIGDIAGFIIPGSDTCLKISGLITAQYTMGSLASYYVPSGNDTLTKHSSVGSDSWGMFDRARVVFDAASNTAYGPLLSHIELQIQHGNLFDSGGGYSGNPDGGYINNAYLQWAGITAGKHASFYDFLGGSINTWDDFISPDHSGTPVPLLAYTATFGGGFSATLSVEQNESAYGANAMVSTTGSTYNATKLGVRSPDFVAALDLSQSWGKAHVAGVLHNIHVAASSNTAVTENDWGWGVIGGLSFNLPSLGAGADVKVQGAYTQGAINYSGVLSPWGSYNYSGVMYGANGSSNGPIADSYYDSSSGWNQTKAWSVAGGADIPFGPTFKVSPEISYGEASVGGLGTTSALSGKLTEWVGGGTLEWTPVKNLVFDLDLLYMAGTQSTPNGWVGTGVDAWKTNFDGFNGKLRIERDF